VIAIILLGALLFLLPVLPAAAASRHPNRAGTGPSGSQTAAIVRSKFETWEMGPQSPGAAPFSLRLFGVGPRHKRGVGEEREPPFCGLSNFGVRIHSKSMVIR